MVTEGQVIEKLKEVYDPEIFINVYDLGLIYSIEIKPGQPGAKGDIVHIRMTLTFQGCPLGTMITGMVEEKIKFMEGVGEVQVELTFDPPWNRDMIKWENIKKQ